MIARKWMGSTPIPATSPRPRNAVGREVNHGHNPASAEDQGWEAHRPAEGGPQTQDDGQSLLVKPAPQEAGTGEEVQRRGLRRRLGQGTHARLVRSEERRVGKEGRSR